MRSTTAKVLSHAVRQHVATMSKLIIITGASGSGKTTLTKLISDVRRSTIVSLDWFYKPVDETVDAKTIDFDHPNSIDWDFLKRVIADITDKRQYVIDEPYDFTIHRRNSQLPPIVIEPTPTIILEGILAAYDPFVRSRADRILFVETDLSLCLVRRMRRDIAERGRTWASVLEQWERYVLPSYRKFIEPQKLNHKTLVIANDNQHDFMNSPIVDELISDLKDK